jgi:hypothetical protein
VDKIDRARELAASGNYRAALNLLREQAVRDQPPYRSRLALAGLYRELECPDQAGRWGIISDGWTSPLEQDRLARLLAASGVPAKSTRVFLRIPHDADDPADLAAVIARVPMYRARWRPRWDWDSVVLPSGWLVRVTRTTAKWMIYLAVAVAIIAMIAVFQYTLTDEGDASGWAIGGSLTFVGLTAFALIAYGVSRWALHRIWSGGVLVLLGVTQLVSVIVAAFL